jgi:hypothetical protein
MADARFTAGMFPSPDTHARPGWACGLFVWVAEPRTAEAVRDLCGPVASYVRRSGTSVVVCRARALGADVATLDALARLHLTGARAGFLLRISDASDGLRGLAAFLGFDVVLRFLPSDVEARGQSEQGEQPGGVEEEHDAADLAVGDIEHLQ